MNSSVIVLIALTYLYWVTVILERFKRKLDFFPASSYPVIA